MATYNSPRKSEDPILHEDFNNLPLARNNFILMAVAGVMIVVGFLLMLGSGSTTEEFNPDIFSTRRIVIGPMICFLGFVAMAVAVCLKPRK
ncbi:MAG: DUF3098 domain-containing protein [Muribaculaceae bacterium]|nr:DUF3098 domain-containing protein [Muribaculaceae bacterium]